MERSHSWSSALACPAQRDAATRQKTHNTKMYKVYILKSKKNGRHYIGHTEDLKNRIIKHNSGSVKSTRSGIPWELLYNEEYKTRSEAYKRELEIKSYKGGIKFKRLLGLWKD